MGIVAQAYVTTFFVIVKVICCWAIIDELTDSTVLFSGSLSPKTFFEGELQ
jgi:hypothetical protein